MGFSSASGKFLAVQKRAYLIAGIFSVSATVYACVSDEISVSGNAIIKLLTGLVEASFEFDVTIGI